MWHIQDDIFLKHFLQFTELHLTMEVLSRNVLINSIYVLNYSKISHIEGGIFLKQFRDFR